MKLKATDWKTAVGNLENVGEPTDKKALAMRIMRRMTRVPGEKATDQEWNEFLESERRKP